MGSAGVTLDGVRPESYPGDTDREGTLAFQLGEQDVELGSTTRAPLQHTSVPVVLEDQGVEAGK